ncbi:MAG: DUF4129 domain-containing protein [Salinigranum sp.]
MDRPTAQSALIALLGVVALALAAATLPSPVRPGRGGSGPPGTGGGSGIVPPPTPQPPVKGFELPVPAELLAALAAVVGLALLAYLVVYRREVLAAALGVAVLAVVIALLFRVLSLLLGHNGFALSPTGHPGLFGGGGAGGTADATAPPLPPVAVALLFVVALVGGAVVLVRSGRDDADEESTDSPGESAAEAVGRAAGRAADRLEASAEVDTEVHRAWREMTALLDVPRPEATTPGEFAAAAVDAGMDPEDVGELTRLFEDARYGGYDPSPEDERRAIEVFRRVEAAYTTEEP